MRASRSSRLSVANASSSGPRAAPRVTAYSSNARAYAAETLCSLIAGVTCGHVSATRRHRLISFCGDSISAFESCRKSAREMRMSEAVATRTPEMRGAAQSALQLSAIVWFVPALIGNWLFAYHVAETYLVTALGGDYTAWT